MKPPEYSVVQNLFTYDKVTGDLVWTRGQNIKMIAGPKGRVRVGNGQYAKASIIWLLVTGSWPVEIIDHADRNPLNFKWDNLREATYSQNACNRGPIGPKKHPKGVYPRKDKWVVKIGLGRLQKELGIYPTVEEAVAAYNREVVVHHGEFAVLSEV